MTVAAGVRSRVYRRPSYGKGTGRETNWALYSTSNSSTNSGTPSNPSATPNLNSQASNVFAVSPAPPFFPAKLSSYSPSTFPDTETLSPGMSPRLVMVGVLRKVDTARVKVEEALP